MPAKIKPRRLGFGRVLNARVNVPILASNLGKINESGVGASIDPGSLPAVLVFGRTVGGVNLPIKINLNGVVSFA